MKKFKEFEMKNLNTVKGGIPKIRSTKHQNENGTIVKIDISFGR